MLVRFQRFLYKRGMTDLDTWIVVSSVLLAAGGLTGLLTKGLRHADVLDRPNERSSHIAPTPRGGGIAILVAGFLGVAVTGLSIPWPIIAGIAWLAIISVLDDLRGVSIIIRLLAQAAIVTVCLTSVGGFIANIGVVLFVGVVVVWIWFINLYNFMDGIDGITGVETISICLGMALVMHVSGHAPVDSRLPLIIAAATAGFMFWNWHPAKIFMGDVGSIPLGFIVGWMLLELAAAGQWAAALILPAYYLADATITLVHRGLRGEKVWRAHKEHFYQRAHQRGLSHADVSLRILFANALLIGLAIVASLGHPIFALAGAASVVGFLLFHLAGSGKTAA